MRSLLKAVPMVLCFLASGVGARADITFGEIVLPNFSALTTQYAGLGVVFTNTEYVTDDRFADGFGIAETTIPSTILFLNPDNEVTLHWMSISTDFQATAYDGSGNVLETYSAPVCDASNGTADPFFAGFYDCKGTATFVESSDISKIVWHDAGQFVALDSLNVPESSPVTLMLGLLGVLMLVKGRGQRRNALI